MTLVFILIALVASTVAGLIKLILFRRQKDTYRHILKFGLLGEVLGTIIMFAIGYLFKSEIDKSDEPEALLAIPFYLMLAGLLIGSMWTYYRGQKVITN